MKSTLSGLVVYATAALVAAQSGSGGLVLRLILLQAHVPRLFADQDSSDSQNFTIALLSADTKEETCEEGDLNNALVLTFSDIPRTATCFNVSDIFGNDAKTGFQNDTTGWDADDEERDEEEALSRGIDIEDLPPKGIHWYRPNPNEPSLASDRNFTRIWFRQVNETGGDDDIGDGKDGRWVLRTYAYEDCQETVRGSDVDDDSDSWYEASCQTNNDGQCETVEMSIKSFQIRPYGENDYGACETWWKAAAPGFHVSLAGVLGAGLIAAFAML